MWGDSGYGPNKLKDYDGEGVGEFLRRCRATKLDGCAEQSPVVRFAKADAARLRAKECVAKLRLVFGRRRSA